MRTALIWAFICAAVIAFGQAPPQNSERSIDAINYWHRSGASKVDFLGTDLLPSAKGEAKVEAKQGKTNIDAKFRDLPRPTSLCSECLTYVLWAITPEGRATNLGEVVPDKADKKLSVTSELQAFAMILTAEPYFAVTQPSDRVVLQNEARKSTKGEVGEVVAKASLVNPGVYNPAKTTLEPIVFQSRLPFEYFEALNAQRIAKASGADKYAEESFAKAEASLKLAQGYASRKEMDANAIITASRDAVQTYEDSRLISIRKQAEERLAQQKAADAAKVAAANAEAERQRREAEVAELAKAKAEAQKAAAEAQQAKAEAERAAALKQEEEARQAALKAVREKEELRAKLLAQLNAVLDTKDSPRGLIVNMSDVLFDSGQFTLRPVAREKLARISGIIQMYPGLELSAEGHTDNVGSDSFNQTLSEKRAAEVKQYLITQGVPEPSISSMGFGEGRPVADNTTAKGRQVNRRVELIVSGEAIGVKLPNSTSRATAP